MTVAIAGAIASAMADTEAGFMADTEAGFIADSGAASTTGELEVELIAVI